MKQEKQEKITITDETMGDWLVDFFLGVRIGNLVFSNPHTFIGKEVPINEKREDHKNDNNAKY